MLNYKKGKLTFNFGTKVTDDQFHQVDESTSNVNDRNFIDWAPQAHVSIPFFATKNVPVLNYNGNTTAAHAGTIPTA